MSHLSGIVPMTLLAAGLACAQGGSAVISLVMPPPGGDGYAALQTGGAFAEGAASLYYNPALLAELERTTGSQLFFTNSSQQLLPVLNIDDLSQAYTAVAIAFPDPMGWDLAVGYSHTSLDFGRNTLPDGSSVESGEDLHALGAGLRLGWPVSVGVTAKYFVSRLANGWARDAYGWAFDFGIAHQPRLALPAREGLPFVELVPSVAVSARNLGPDVFYQEASQADPIPRTFAWEFGLRANAFDLVEAQGGYDSERESTRRGSARAVITQGFSVSALGIRYSRAWLDDPGGKRYERHSGLALELNFLRLRRAWMRFQTGDFHSHSQAMDRGFPFASVSVFGLPYRANPRLILGRREIRSFDNGIRNGQKATYVSLSL